MLPPREAAAQPGSVGDRLQDLVAHAGLRDVRIEEITLALEFPTIEDCIQYLMDVSPDLSDALSGRSQHEQDEYRRRLGDELRQFTAADGSVRSPNVTLCATGRR